MTSTGPARIAKPHSSHWGAFEAIVEGERVVAARPCARDADPSPLLTNIPSTLAHPARVAQPMIRRGWLERGPGQDSRRGAEPFVPVGWDEAIELLAGALRQMYEAWRGPVLARGFDVPEFDRFWAAGFVELPFADDDLVLFESFRRDPEGAPLKTPSGRIELFSATIAGFGDDDCPGHPVWREPAEWLGGDEAGRFPLQLIANNPATRLHSQLDMGAHSQASKIRGREPVRLHPVDAARRGIAAGDVVRLFNARGSCLAGAVLSEAVRPGVVQLSTGAWYDPLDPADPNAMCVHGNPNVLTRDAGTSRLAQGCTGQHALVEVERWDGEVPPIRAYDPPATVLRSAAARSGRPPRAVPRG